LLAAFFIGVPKATTRKNERKRQCLACSGRKGGTISIGCPIYPRLDVLALRD